MLLSSCLLDETGDSSGESIPPQHPNVLVFITDDQRAEGTLNVMPQTMSWFGQGGTRYPNAFATTPLCCPFRVSLFSGRYAHNHGVRTNLGAPNFERRLSIQRFLQERGYTTAIAGKYLNRWPIETSPPHFDRYAFFDPRKRSRGYFQGLFNVDGDLRQIETYLTDYVAERAVQFLNEFESDDGRPWLMFVAPYAPHKPAFPAPEYEGVPVAPLPQSPELRARLDRERAEAFDLPEKTPRTGVIRRRQLRSLLSVDDLVEDVTKTLETLDEAEDTLAVYISDAGYLWGEYGLAGKRLPYTDSIQIPLLFHWPDKGHPRVDRRLATNIDVVPTILDALGFEPDEELPLDGASLLEPDERSRVLIEYWADPVGGIPPWASIRTRRYQYVEYFLDDGPRYAEYYDLKSDPHELHNLLSDEKRSNDPASGHLARVRALLRADMRCSGSTCP